MGIYFSISSIIFLFIFIIIFFSKDNSKNIETKMYSILLVLTFLGTILDIVGFSLYKQGMEVNSFIYKSLARVMLIYFILWSTLFFKYTYSVSEKKIFQISNIVIVIAFIICSFGAVVLPINFKIMKNVIYPIGMGVNFTYFVITVSLILSLILAFNNLKNIKKYTPIFLITLMVIASMVIQKVLPELFLINFSLTIVIVVMYFTIENPDLKIIEELKKNRSLTSKSYIEKTNFLFRMSAEVRKPIENIKELNDYNIESNNIKEIKENSKEIDLNIRNANFTINNVLDVSSLDTKNINIVKNKYNIKKLLNEIYLREKKKINNIRFDFNIGELPEYLYGDSIRLKQVLICILDNLIENTKEGFIEVNVNSINKYDVCRLIITIENSGIPLSLEEINNILDNEKEIDENISLEDINKLINMMNGSLNIKSEEGNEFTISIDSIIVEPKKEEITNETDILFISNNERILKGLEYAFEEYTTNSVMSGIDAIDLIKSGENYNLIIIDDEMKPISGLETLKRLRKENINIPAIIMLDEGKEHIKNHYIKDGFTDYILKNDIKNEINRIIKKML